MHVYDDAWNVAGNACGISCMFTEQGTLSSKHDSYASDSALHVLWARSRAHKSEGQAHADVYSMMCVEEGKASIFEIRSMQGSCYKARSGQKLQYML